MGVCGREGLTGVGVGVSEVLWVASDESFQHVNLLQCDLRRVEVLRPAWHIRRPELQHTHTHTHTHRKERHIRVSTNIAIGKKLHSYQYCNN